MTPTPMEAEMIRSAKERLAQAETGLTETTHLPAGDERREKAIREFHVAKAYAAEWGAILFVVAFVLLGTGAVG